MSDAKRDNQVFRFTAVATHAAERARVPGAAPPQSVTLETLDVAAPWGSTAAHGGDPYNARGRRAVSGSGRR